MTNSVVPVRDTNGSHALNNHLKSVKNRKSITNHQTIESSESTFCSIVQTQSKRQPATFAITNSGNQTKRAPYHKENRLAKVHSIEAINYNVSNLAGKFDKLNQRNRTEKALRQMHGM